MTVYEYDGTFQGFLTALFEAITGGLPPDDITACGSEQPALCAARVVVETEKAKILQIGSLLEAKIGGEIMKNVLYAFVRCGAAGDDDFPVLRVRGGGRRRSGLFPRR